MAIRARKLRRFAAQLLTLLGVGLLLMSLALLAKTTQNSEQFGRLLPWIFGINLTGASVLLVLIVANLVRLAREYRGEFGPERQLAAQQQLHQLMQATSAS